MSERNEVVVTYADLSESSDNEAIGGLLDEHAIGKANVIQDEICWCYIRIYTKFPFIQ